MVYPYYSKLQNIAPKMNEGNFGLWYNKFIPVSNFDACKASDDRGDDKNAVSYYHRQYNKLEKNTIKRLLDEKHQDQSGFCDALSSGYETVIFKARLKSPLITGIGESHPHEVSMIFEHNMGIPYIPATGIKGIVRFAHTIGLISGLTPEKIETDKEGKAYFNDEENWTNVPNLFGTQSKRGAAIFLDAYPETIPALHVDIMNPHYGEYYSTDSNEIPPGDYLNTNPIKFLTVAKDTIFIFRALVDKEKSDLVEMVKTAFRKALTEEGVGAKTAVGYGLFDNIEEKEADSVLVYIKKEKEKKAQKAQEAIDRAEAERVAGLTEDEKMIEKITGLQNDSSQIAELVKTCFSGSYENSVYSVLKKKLEKLGQWKPGGSKQRKTKMQKRNTEIESKINM